MLIQPDKAALGDGKLSAQEALLRAYADTDRRLQAYRVPDHEDLKNVELRLGSPMPHTELIRRVVKLNPRIWAETSINFPENWGFYTTAPDGTKRFLVAAPKGVLPEHSWVETDRADLAIKEHRGWRTVLVRLLDAGVLTWDQVTAGFGDSNSTARNSRWRQFTQRHRTGIVTPDRLRETALNQPRI